MKYVYFNSLSIRNFLSVGDQPVTIGFKPGFNIITGLNKDKEDRRNGVGKSTIADAIYFAVFGDTLRELKKEHIPNNINQKGCEVVLEFVLKENEDRTNYKIVRLLNPTKCYLYVDGEDKTHDTISNTNEYINTIINSSPEIFQNCIIMTVNNTVPFMAKKKIEKRKFIEGIFNLQVFSRMLSNIRSEYNDIMREFDSECVRYEEISNALQTYTEQKQNYSEHKLDQLQKLQVRKNNNITEVTTLTERLKELKTQGVTNTTSAIRKVQDNQSLCQTKLEQYNKKITSTEITINHLNDRHDKIGTTEDICPTCLRPLKTSDKNHIEIQRKNILNDIKTEKTTQKNLLEKTDKVSKINIELKDQLHKYTTIVQENSLRVQQVKNTSERIAQIKEWNTQIVDDISQLDTQDTSIDDIVKKCIKRLEQVQKIIDDIKKQINILDVIKFIVSEEGVKSYIVKKILQLFNGKLSYYLKKMDSNCICVFNEYFEEQIIDEKGKLCSYFNFSGAERKNIDLACLFAFMDIRRLQGDVAFNFSIYDELLDSSLDERGVELVVNILNERIEKYNESIMVISHRKESAKLATSEIIFLEKRNGITTRVELPHELE